jgi:hypothetical protein
MFLRVVPQTMKSADLDAASLRFSHQLVHDISERIVANLKVTLSSLLLREF